MLSCDSIVAFNGLSGDAFTTWTKVGNRSNRSNRSKIKSIKDSPHYPYLKRFCLSIEALASNYLLQGDQEEEMAGKSQLYSRTEGIEPLPQYDAVGVILMAL